MGTDFELEQDARALWRDTFSMYLDRLPGAWTEKDIESAAARADTAYKAFKKTVV